MKKNIETIKKYWEDRANMYKVNPKATTDDIWLRKIEIKSIKRVLKLIKNKKDVLDIGCGDGFSTLDIAKSFPNSNFIGGDYSSQMIDNANLLAKEMRIPKEKINFLILDVIDMCLNKKFDVIISDRCLINLPSRELQQKAIREIYNSLKKGGYYIMVENFIEGHNKMNELRRKLKIKEIPIRWHNLFFDEKFLKNKIIKLFNLEKRENISSIYYLITRVVYSKICQSDNKQPEYDNIFYQIAGQIDENCGNFGPVNLILFKK
jgi:SAM-dependent methyltransferase